VFLADPDLLRRFRKGEREALARVYDHYVGAIESLLRRCIAASAARSGDRSLASRSDLADLVQDVFIKAFAQPARSSYDGVREYRPFLFALCRNVLVDYLRRRGKEVHMDMAAIELLGDRDPPGPDDELPWADGETILLVEGYLRGLTEREHAVYVQRYVHCRPQIEAAAALGLSRQQLRTAEAHLRRGLARELARANLGPPEPRPAVFSPSPTRETDRPPAAAQPERIR